MHMRSAGHPCHYDCRASVQVGEIDLNRRGGSVNRPCLYNHPSREFLVCVKTHCDGVELPLDHLRDLWPEKFRGARVGALLHPASVSAKLEHTANVLEQHNGDLF